MKLQPKNSNSKDKVNGDFHFLQLHALTTGLSLRMLEKKAHDEECYWMIMNRNWFRMMGMKRAGSIDSEKKCKGESKMALLKEFPSLECHQVAS